MPRRRPGKKRVKRKVQGKEIKRYKKTTIIDNHGVERKVNIFELPKEVQKFVIKAKKRGKGHTVDIRKMEMSPSSLKKLKEKFE